MEDDPVSFTCKTSKPTRDVLWLRDQEDVTSEDRYRRTVEEDTHTLSITQAQVADSGEFSAQLGEEKTSAALVVKGETDTGLKWCMTYFN